jgi:hypothetical protein
VALCRGIAARRLGGGRKCGRAPADETFEESRPAAWLEWTALKNVKLELTVEEPLLVTTLISHQLFREEFIDTKMPGYKGDPAELVMGKDLVLRLESIIRQASESSTGSVSRRAPSHLSGTRKEFQMPFDQFTPRFFTPASLRANAPAASGIYGVSNAREWIYIGETDNIEASLLNDLQQRDLELFNRCPTGFVFELCDPVGGLARHNRLILEYEPVCNRRLGNGTGGTR